MLRCEPGPVTVVTLDRPPANTLDGAFFEELTELLARLDDPAVRAVVITGTGRFFSAGLDLFEVFAAEGPAFDEFAARFDAGFAALFGFRKPVVAAVNGHAVAGGAVLAAAADVRLVAEGEARLGLTEIQVGLPFPASALEIVRTACGGPQLAELLYLGHTYAPREACLRRLADEVVPAADLMARALAVAGELGAREPAAFASIKYSLRADALRRLDTARVTGDPAWDVWRRPETRAAVAAYRARTLGARRGR
jgi:enoyl-CoA hydratase